MIVKAVNVLFEQTIMEFYSHETFILFKLNLHSQFL